MQQIKKKIQGEQQLLEQALARPLQQKDIDKLRVDLLGKKGIVTELMVQLKTLSVEEKKEVGPLLNQFKQFIEEKLETARISLVSTLATARAQKKQAFDVTAYAPKSLEGHLHPYTQFVEEVEDIFLSMGYEILDGPELETDEHNFTALNIPKDHPARDMYDTFWTDKPNILMRTHTSPVQVSAMKNKPLPLAGIAPGRVYRHEAVDASHDYMFMQCEGVFIDKNVSMAHLFATAQTFLKTLFKKDELDIRIRPGFFPFVEPGVEIDMRCPFCEGGCSVCKRSTWIEVFPGGMIHPNVLRFCGIDPEVYSGFAFGFGLTRLAMLKYNINDIRLLCNGRVKFLEQF